MASNRHPIQSRATLSKKQMSNFKISFLKLIHPFKVTFKRCVLQPHNHRNSALATNYDGHVVVCSVGVVDYCVLALAPVVAQSASLSRLLPRLPITAVGRGARRGAGECGEITNAKERKARG